MHEQLYRMAERNILIRSVYPQVHDYCRAYRAQGEPDFVVAVAQADLDAERRIAAREAETEGLPPRRWTDAYLEELAVYRKIAAALPAFDTILFHGSAVAADGVCYLFTAKSGVGKSTHTRLWRAVLGDRAVMINDDKPLLRIDNTETTVFGTPYDGKHRLSSNTSAPLGAICLLARGETNRIRRVSAANALPDLLRQVFRPTEPEAMRQTLALVDRLAARTPLFRLECNPEPEAARIAYEAMRQK